MRSTRVTGSGLFIDGEIAAAWWPALRDWAAIRAARDGGVQMRPGHGEALEDLRAVASEYHATKLRAMSAGGHVSALEADMAAPLAHAQPDDVTAAELGELLRVTPRHARRLAEKHGLEPKYSNPYRYDRADVAVLMDLRRSA